MKRKEEEQAQQSRIKYLCQDNTCSIGYVRPTSSTRISPSAYITVPSLGLVYGPSRERTSAPNVELMQET